MLQQRSILSQIISPTKIGYVPRSEMVLSNDEEMLQLTEDDVNRDNQMGDGRIQKILQQTGVNNFMEAFHNPGMSYSLIMEYGPDDNPALSFRNNGGIDKVCETCQCRYCDDNGHSTEICKYGILEQQERVVGTLEFTDRIANHYPSPFNYTPRNTSYLQRNVLVGNIGDIIFPPKLIGEPGYDYIVRYPTTFLNYDQLIEKAKQRKRYLTEEDLGDLFTAFYRLLPIRNLEIKNLNDYKWEELCQHVKDHLLSRSNIHSSEHSDPIQVSKFGELKNTNMMFVLEYLLKLLDNQIIPLFYQAGLVHPDSFETEVQKPHLVIAIKQKYVEKIISEITDINWNIKIPYNGVIKSFRKGVIILPFSLPKVEIYDTQTIDYLTTNRLFDDVLNFLEIR